MNFANALKALFDGKAVRLGWWNPDLCVCSQLPDGNSKMTHAYLYIDGDLGLVPWLPTQVELFSEQWEIA